MSDGKAVGLVWYPDELDRKDFARSRCAPERSVLRPSAGPGSKCDLPTLDARPFGPQDIVSFQDNVGPFGVPSNDMYCHPDHLLESWSPKHIEPTGSNSPRPHDRRLV
jgi:hypothetical protein